MIVGQKNTEDAIKDHKTNITTNAATEEAATAAEALHKISRKKYEHKKYYAKHSRTHTHSRTCIQQKFQLKCELNVFVNMPTTTTKPPLMVDSKRNKQRHERWTDGQRLENE